ncbi:MAG: hypothetical protein AABY64_14610 [Bdellovibrionota bacterium]
MANKKVKKQSVKSSTKNKTSPKPKAKSGGALKAPASKLAKKISAKPPTPVKKADEKLKKAATKEVRPKETLKKLTVEEANSKKATKAPKEAKDITAAAKLPKPTPVKKAKAPKVQKSPKEGADLEDDFLSDDIEAIEDIGEYEEELKAVEEADEEVEDETAWDLENKENTEDEIILTDAEGRRYCRARDCDQISAVDAYCRYHYLLFWKKIQIRKKILLDGKLERYVEELTGRFPDKFLEMIRRDLRTTKDFLSAIQELEIDESAGGDNDFEEESQSFIDEVRGLNESPGVDEEEF